MFHRFLVFSESSIEFPFGLPDVEFVAETFAPNGISHAARLIREIAFLDVSVCRQDNGQLANKVYRKPTHTERYLAFESHHPIAHNKAVVKSLNRASNIPTTSDYRSKELKQVISALLANGYPKRFIIDSNKPKRSPQQSAAGRA